LIAFGKDVKFFLDNVGAVRIRKAHNTHGSAYAKQVRERFAGINRGKESISHICKMGEKVGDMTISSYAMKLACMKKVGHERFAGQALKVRA
jgi:hypothetical protein